MTDRMFFGQVPIYVIRQASKQKQTKMFERIWCTEKGRLVSRWAEAPRSTLPNKTLARIAAAEPMERDVDSRPAALGESPKLHYGLFCIAALFDWELPR